LHKKQKSNGKKKDNKSPEKIAVIISYEKHEKQKERQLGILKGKVNYKIKESFKISDEELLTS